MYVLRVRLKDMRLWMFLISAGRLFHSLRASDWKARSPSVGRNRALAGTNKVAFLDLRLYLDWAATAIRSTRYCTMPNCQEWNIVKAIQLLRRVRGRARGDTKFLFSCWKMFSSFARYVLYKHQWNTNTIATVYFSRVKIIMFSRESSPNNNNNNKQSIAWPVSKDPRETSCRHSHHQQMAVK